MRKFLDEARIKIKSGKGGDGMVAFRREKYVPKGGPAGGDGGRGGDVYLVGDENLTTLMDFKHKSVFQGENGEKGNIKNCHGKGAKDLFIKVPLGTVVVDEKDGKIIADLTEEGQTILVAKGGRGGRGNARFATANNKCPQFCEPGEAGIERNLRLQLKLIADVGLLGMPNAGKSTLISVMSSAKPKIADYPFTTLIPNLGVVKKPSGDGFVIADIPGLIEGASRGVGLGHNFLKHVERCRFFIHIVDLTSKNPLENYQKINNELQLYNERLAGVFQIIALNKIDSVSKEVQEKYLQEFKKISNNVFLISAATKEGLKEFTDFVCEMSEKIEKPHFDVEVEEDFAVYDNDDSAFEITKLNKNTYLLTGGKLERLANITNPRNSVQMHRLSGILEAMGVIKALKGKGIKENDTFIIARLEFTYYN